MSLFFTDAERKYYSYIRRFSAKAILDKCFLLSCKIFNNPAKNKGVIEETQFLPEQTQPFYLTQWELAQICFFAIINTNDNRKDNISNNEFYELYRLNRIVEEERETSFVNQDNILVHMYQITNMEFDWQTPDYIRRFNRLYHMMIVLNSSEEYSSLHKNYICFSTDFERINGITVDEYIRYFIWIVFIYIGIGQKSSSISLCLLQYSSLLSSYNIDCDSFYKFIESVSKDYTFFRNHPSHNWNLVRFYPIIKTDNDSLHICNINSMLLFLSEFLYWSIRNYYADKHSQQFVNYFGYCFEDYVDNLLSSLDLCYRHIPETTKQTPDWEIDTENYIFIVEQKTSLFPIETRDTGNKDGISKLDEYFQKKIMEAFKQLDNYSVDTTKTLIRICLTYENISIPTIAQDTLTADFPFEYRHLFWILHINEFEDLFALYSTDKVLFSDLIQKKILLELNKDPNGRSISKLINDSNIKHFKQLPDYFSSFYDNEKDLVAKLQGQQRY